MLMTLEQAQTLGKLITQNLICVNEDGSRSRYIFNGGDISIKETESLLEWDDFSFGYYGYHPIINYMDLRKRAPGWQNCDEYLTEQLMKNARHAKGYGKRKRMKEIEEMLSNGKLI